MVFPVVMYGCESWTIKQMDAFDLWCWIRLLRVPWTARRSNKSILKEISSVLRTDAEAEAPILWPPNAQNQLIRRDLDDGKKWKKWQILFSWAPKSLQMVTVAMKLKDTYSLEGKL